MIISLLSCRQSFVNSIYPIPSKQLFKKQLYYEKKYGYISSQSDTVFIDGELCKFYKKGVLSKIGKVIQNKQVGYWYIFRDSLQLEFILKFNSNTIDSFYHPFSIVNKSW
jgi:hypothetical protein